MLAEEPPELVAMKIERANEIVPIAPWLRARGANVIYTALCQGGPLDGKSRTHAAEQWNFGEEGDYVIRLDDKLAIVWEWTERN
jgi:hypothetical protein